ncbi:hypothetical protein BASA83_000193 [Batrachochytrium salamandrivorans]|nr:hypothetical protein BASA83_000193 [Batrachochytrium salamandrivorans]
MVSTQFALLGGNTCRCILSLATLDQTMHAVNTPECSLDCSDGLPCGSSAALNRFSVYNVTEASLPATNPTSSLSSSSLPPMSTQSNGPTGPSNESVGPGKSINQQQIAIIVGILGGIVICAAIFIILFRRHRKLKATPATPTIDVAGSNDYLIPKLLPRTPNQLYSVHAPYTARREMKCLSSQSRYWPFGIPTRTDGLWGQICQTVLQECSRLPV